jgi:hypothetical protein
VRVYDFVIPEPGKVSPYGVYDPTRNEAWVNVGADHDTATFAVASIRGWWQSMGRTAYPDAKELLITADGGGSDSSRSRLKEDAVARTGRRNRTVSRCLPLSARRQQVE